MKIPDEQKERLITKSWKWLSDYDDSNRTAGDLLDEANWIIDEVLDLLREGDKPICSECGNECEMIEHTFDYAGTHCTNGKAGTHHTGIYESNCCDADAE